MKSSANRPSSSTDSKIEELDQKWSDWFNWLEALLMARTLDQTQETTCSTVKMTPAHGPPVNVVRTEPFLKSADQVSSQPSDQPYSDSLATNHPSKHRSTDKSGSDFPQASHWPITTELTGQPVMRPTNSAIETAGQDNPSSDSDCFTSDRPLVDLFTEEGELSDDQDLIITDTDQSLSEGHTYRETMRGIRSYMEWTRVLDIDTGTATSDDKAFAGPKLQTPGKV